MKFEKNEFSLWLIDLVKNKLKSYQFDIFYDIHKIVNQLLEKHGTEKPSEKTYFLCIRETGTWLIDSNNPKKQAYFDQNSEVYELTFCFNSDYFREKSFVTINQIK